MEFETASIIHPCVVGIKPDGDHVTITYRHQVRNHECVICHELIYTPKVVPWEEEYPGKNPEVKS